jgi:hypothetical protein
LKLLLVLQQLATICKKIQDKIFWALYPQGDSKQNSQHIVSNTLRKNAKIERVQNPVHNTEICTDLQKIIAVWLDLPEHIKAAIKAFVQTHSNGDKK